jgi:hypothetical protein
VPHAVPPASRLTPAPQRPAALDLRYLQHFATAVFGEVTRHGRATPLVWKTVPKSTLEGKRNGYEHALVERLHAIVPPAVRVVLLADRGFGDQKLYVLLGALG